MITIFGGLASPFVARCVMALRLKGLEHRLDFPFDGLKSPEFLAINPFGKIPVMQDEGFTLPESEVICEYLEDNYGDPPLMPADPQGRARSRLVSRVVDLYLLPAVFALSRQSDPALRDEAAVTARLADFMQALDALEHAMLPGPYAIDGKPGLADCTLVTALCHVQRVMPVFRPEPFAGHPKLDAYARFVTADPLCGAMLQEMQQAWTEMMQGRAEAN